MSLYSEDWPWTGSLPASDSKSAEVTVVWHHTRLPSILTGKCVGSHDTKTAEPHILQKPQLTSWELFLLFTPVIYYLSIYLFIYLLQQSLSHSVAQVDLELTTIPLPQPSKYWNYMVESSHLAFSYPYCCCCCLGMGVLPVFYLSIHLPFVSLCRGQGSS